MLIRPDNCEKCGEMTRVQAHHEDYSKHLKINWLCSKCHARLHSENRKEVVLSAEDILITTNTK